MKRRFMTYGLIGAVCMVTVFAADTKSFNKSDNKGKNTVAVVSYKNTEDGKKADNSENATTGAVSATTEAITSYASGRKSEVSLNKGKTQRKNKAADKKVKKNPRREIVKLAKKYKGKITYLWGGKPTDSQIKGKEQPKKLDCSGFIQFVYSRYNKQRIEALGSTISISGLPKIKKKELRPGDIGLRNGTGSLYFDADGKSYAEPGIAQDANESKEKSFDKKIKARKTKKTQLKDRIEEKKDKISEYKDKIAALNEKKDEVIDTAESEVSSDNDEQQTEISDEEKEQQKQQKIEQQKKKNDKIEADIKSYNEKIQKCQSDIKGYSKRIKKYDKQLKKLKKQREKYKKDIEESIDHVGIYCGKNRKGEAVWCHCSSSKGGVVYEVTDIFTHYYSAKDYLSE